MTPERKRLLDTDMKAKLTQEEIDEGWLFCCEWDGLLIHRTDPEAECCTCLKHDGSKEEKKDETI